MITPIVKALIPLFFVSLLSCSKNKGNNQPGAIPKMSAADVLVLEGTSGNSTVEIKLTLDNHWPEAVKIIYSTVDGTAKGGEDFTTVIDQEVSFQPHETEKSIFLEIIADDHREADETFYIRLEKPVNAILLKSTVMITLKNDDTRIAFTDTGYDAPVSYTGYTLAWSDEFNGESLDDASWSAENGDGCPGLCGWGNNELQYYSLPPSNLFFQDGKMIIEAKSESYGGKNYTSARIKTQGKKFFKYGRIDIRAILPKGKGIWPAFWMLPQNNVYGGWPKSGEIDIMELVGSEPATASATVHFGPGPGSIYISRNYTLTGSVFNDGFHVFSLEWKPDQLKFYVDNNLYSTVNKADLGAHNYPFNEDFYFVINLAVGGNLPGSPDSGTYFPQWLIVDYIRMYQE